MSKKTTAFKPWMFTFWLTARGANKPAGKVCEQKVKLTAQLSSSDYWH